MALTTLTIAGILGFIRRHWARIKSWYRRRGKKRTDMMIYGDKGIGKTNHIYKLPDAQEFLKPNPIFSVSFSKVELEELKEIKEIKVINEEDPVLKKYKKLKERKE